MTEFCNYEFPPDDCHSIADYVSDIIDSLLALPRVVYHEDSLFSGFDPDLTDIWGECGPPECGIVIWNDLANQEYEVWSYINGSWRNTGSASYVTPYYTTFEGASGLMQDDWVGNWVVNAAGRLYPRLTLSGTELLLNPSFEDWTLGAPDDWSSSDGFLTEETTTVQDQDSSLALDLEFTGAPAYAANVSQTVALTQARWYAMRIYANCNSEIDNFTIQGTGFTVGQTTSFDEYGNGWIRKDATAFSLIPSMSLQIALTDGPIVAGDPPKPTTYLDNASMQQIVSGWNLTKEFYTAYGTLYCDLTMREPSIGGLLINYQDDDNYAMVLIRSSATIYLVEVTAGSASVTNSWVGIYTDGARLEVSRNSDDTVDISYNGASIVTGQALVSPIATTVHGLVAVSFQSFFSAFGFTPE